MSLIKALNEITAHDLTRVGGKALNCARLLQAGLPVPDGFVVLAGAEDGFSLGAELDVFLKKVPADMLLAIRSSAIGEDSTAHSFVGIHTTKLNVTRDGVAEAIRACRESVRSPEVMSYRRALGLPLHDFAGGVLVQHMVIAGGRPSRD